MDYFHEIVIDKTSSKTEAGNYYDLGGYKDFSLLGRFEGKPNSSVYMEVSLRL